MLYIRFRSRVTKLEKNRKQRDNLLPACQPACLPDHKNWPTAQTTRYMASILPLGDGYIGPIEPLLYR